MSVNIFKVHCSQPSKYSSLVLCIKIIFICDFIDAPEAEHR